MLSGVGLPDGPNDACLLGLTSEAIPALESDLDLVMCFSKYNRMKIVACCLRDVI